MPRAAYPGPVKSPIIPVVTERRPVARTSAGMGTGWTVRTGPSPAEGFFTWLGLLLVGELASLRKSHTIRNDDVPGGYLRRT